MHIGKGCALLAISGIAAGAYAQGASESIVKLPDQIEFKAPLTPGPQTAVLYGDPTKAGVYVTQQDTCGIQGHAALAPRCVAYSSGFVGDTLFWCWGAMGR
jgi:hypothetical protein